MAKKIIAITACPTGIAHTYMAAEKMQKVGAKLGYDVKVETQGTSGAKNILTQKDIDEADGIIFAIDKNIDESRFAGKQVYRCAVAAALKDPEAVFDAALNKKGTEVIAAAEIEGQEAAKPAGKGIKSVYNHLMNGVSHMLPVVVAGGILTALSFAFGIYAYQDEGSLPAALYTIGASGALGLMVPVLAAFIADSISGRAGFAAGLIGGYVASSIGSGFIGGIIAGFLAGYVTLAIVKYIKVPKSLSGIKDILIVPILSVGITGLVMIFIIGTPIAAMNAGITNFLTSLSDASYLICALVFGLIYWDLGGPFSKILYAFAIGMVAEGIYWPMAATMVCGMIPPIGIAIATFVAPKLWTKDQKEAGKAALVLGLSYITEGAIPFATENPLVVLPSCIVGGMVGSFISMVLGVGITAPHGGLFLLFIPGAITNSVGFLIALAVGAVVEAVVLIILKTVQAKKAN